MQVFFDACFSFYDLILFFVKTVRFNEKASRKARCQFCALGHKTRLIGYKTALSRFMGDQYDSQKGRFQSRSTTQFILLL